MGILYQGVVPAEVDGGGRFVLDRQSFQPAYLASHASGRLKEKAEEALALLQSCELCPRNCRVDRLADRYAVCKSGRYARVATAFPHFGEEDVLRGWRGSGTIFFSWCNLRCVFCQNFDVSQQGQGEELGPDALARLMVRLQEMGCHNINFVTPEHVVPQILEALPLAVEMGLRVPLVYNTSAYDSPDSLRLMEGVVDVYMPDFKLWDREHARRYLLAPDYPQAAQGVIPAMHEQVGELRVDADGLALRGVLARHLVMPGMLEDTAEIMGYLACQLSPDTYVNIMDQYRPAWKAAKDRRYAEIDRPVLASELREAFACARQAGLWRFDTTWRRLPTLVR